MVSLFAIRKPIFKIKFSFEFYCVPLLSVYSKNNVSHAKLRLERSDYNGKTARYISYERLIILSYFIYQYKTTFIPIIHC